MKSTITLLIIILSLCAITSNALQYGNFTYSTNNNTATITGYTGTEEIINIPPSIEGYLVIAVANRAFEDSFTLMEVTIPDSVTSIGSASFYFCSNLTHVVMSQNLTSIGNHAFALCYNLLSIKIPNGVTVLDDGIFYQCYSLESISLSANLTTIWNDTFWYCRSLTNIIFPDTLELIGGMSFGKCTHLNTITLPENLTLLGGSVFLDCKNLTGVYFKGDEPFDDYTSNLDGTDALVYYLPNKTGWDTNYNGRPTVLWNPSIQSKSIGVQNDVFGFDIIGPTNALVKIESRANLIDNIWNSKTSHTLNNGFVHFVDPSWTNYPNRFYRLNMPD